MRQRKSRERFDKQKHALHRDNVVLIEATQEALDTLKAKGYEYKPVKYTTFYEVSLPKGATIEQALERFDDLGVNDSVEFDTEVKPVRMPIQTPPLPGSNWYGYAGEHSMLMHMQYYDVGTRNGLVGTTDNMWQDLYELSFRRPLTPMIVAVIELGVVKNTHSALAGRLILPSFPSSSSLEWNDHATWVASVIAMNTEPYKLIGCAPTSKIWSLSISGSVDVLKAMQQCIDKNIRIVNLSIDAVGGKPWKQLTRVARKRNMIICISSGNKDYQDDTTPNSLVKDNPNVLSITGTGSGTDSWFNAAKIDEWVNFSGPFFANVPPYNDSGTIDDVIRVAGTSFSSPTIASLFANMLSINPSLTWDDAVTLAARNCIPMKPSTFEPEVEVAYGHGLPQFRKILRDVVAESPISGIYRSDRSMIRQMANYSESNARYMVGLYDENRKKIWQPTYDFETYTEVEIKANNILTETGDTIVTESNDIVVLEGS